MQLTFWRSLKRRRLANQIVRNGMAIRRLQRESVELQFAGLSVEDIHEETERRERRHDTLLTKFKEAH